MASTLPTVNDCCSMCDGLSVEIETTTSVVTGNAGFYVADTLTALRAIATSVNNRFAVLLGDTAKYDFGPAKYYNWDATSVEADNPFLVVVPNDDAGVGRWVQVT